MKFSNMELQCLNRIIDSQPLYGLSLESEDIPYKEQGIEFVTEELKKKNIIDEKGNLTSLSVFVVESLRQYKKASEYIFINRMRISNNRDNSMTIIAKREDGKYDIMRKNNDELMLAIIEASPGLNSLENASSADTFQLETVLAHSEWEKEWEGISECIALHKYRPGEVIPATKHIYYWQNGKGKMYNDVTGRLFSAGRKTILLSIAEELGCQWRKEVI